MQAGNPHRGDVSAIGGIRRRWTTVGNADGIGMWVRWHGVPRGHRAVHEPDNKPRVHRPRTSPSDRHVNNNKAKKVDHIRPRAVARRDLLHHRQWLHTKGRVEQMLFGLHYSRYLPREDLRCRHNPCLQQIHKSKPC